MIDIKHYPDDAIEKGFTLDQKDVTVKVEFTGIKTKPQLQKQPLPVMKATVQVQNNVQRAIDK